MISSFKDPSTARLWLEGKSRSIPAALTGPALRKLAMLHFATTLNDLRAPPGNRLEALRANRKGQHGIRINDRFRICFAWRDAHAYGVEIVDYHR